LLKFNSAIQSFLLLASVINATVFYLVRGDEALSLTLYVLIFLLQALIVASCILDIFFNKRSSKYLAFGVVGIYAASILFLGSETDTLLYKTLLISSFFMLALHGGRNLRASWPKMRR